MKREINIKKRVISVAVVLSVIVNVFTITALAVGGREIISAWLCRDVKMMWNGEEFTPTEDNGERIYPIIYNDRTYLPVRFVAEKAGINVGWDSNSNSVQLGTNGYTYTVETPKAPETPETSNNDYGNITNSLFDFGFVGDIVSGKLQLIDADKRYIDSNGYWIADDYSIFTKDMNGNIISAQYSYVFPDLHFSPVDNNNSTLVPEAEKSICNALTENGFQLIKTDAFQKKHYVKGTTEFNVWNIGGGNTTLVIGVQTGYQADCVK